MGSFVGRNAGFALLALALAGCVGGDATSRVAMNENDVPPLLEDAGQILGKATDDELQPLPGALVGIAALSLVATTDAQGDFVLANVPPGEHAVAAQALGYESAAKRVQVSAGEQTTVSFILPRLPTDAPHHFTDIRLSSQRTIVFKLTPQCVYSDVNPLVTTCNGIRFNCSPQDACEVHYDEDLGEDTVWNTIVGEVDWQPQSAATGKAFLFDINAPNITRGTGGSIVPGDPYTWKAMDSKAPLGIRIDNPTSLEERQVKPEDYCCDWFFRLFTGWCDLGDYIGDCETIPDYGVSLDNTATVYFTIFWREPGPPGFTAIADG